MAAITRGRAFLEESRTIILGNSVATKPYPSSFSIPKKPQQLQTQKITTIANRTLIHPPSQTTKLIPSLAHLTLERGFANETKSERKVYLPEDVELNKLNFGPPIKAKGNNKIIPIRYETDIKTLKIQTPPIRIPFGLGSDIKGPQELGGTPSYSLVLNLDNIDSDPEIKKFVDVMNAIDDKIMKACEKHGKEWFERDIPTAVLQHTFKKAVRSSKDSKYPPNLKVKVPVLKDGSGALVPQINVFKDKKPVEIADLVPNSKIVGILELKYLWSAAGTMVGSTWSLLQVKILEKGADKSDRLSGYAFIERPEKN